MCVRRCVCVYMCVSSLCVCICTIPGLQLKYAATPWLPLVPLMTSRQRAVFSSPWKRVHGRCDHQPGCPLEGGGLPGSRLQELRDCNSTPGLRQLAPPWERSACFSCRVLDSCPQGTLRISFRGGWVAQMEGGVLEILSELIGWIQSLIGCLDARQTVCQSQQRKLVDGGLALITWKILLLGWKVE